MVNPENTRVGDTGHARQGHQNPIRNERARHTLVAETRTQHTHTHIHIHTHHSNNFPTQAVIPVLNCHGSPDILSTILTLLKAGHETCSPSFGVWKRVAGVSVLPAPFGIRQATRPRVNMCWTKHNSAHPAQSSTRNAAPPRMRGNYTVHMTCRLFLGSVRETPRVQLRLP